MLRIKIIRGGGAEAARYHAPENERRPDEYYGREVEVRAVWWSPGGTFGVQSGAEVKPDEVRHAMEGRDPAGSGKPLVQMQRRAGGQGRRAAYDLNMSLPKSVSVLYAAADRDTRAAMLAETRGVAVEVLAEMQRQGAFTVRHGKGGAVQEGAADVLALVDVHQSARDGAPFLHVHAVVMNFGRRGDGTTTSLNDREMHRAVGEAGALFHAGVAAALERRGFGIERVAGEEGRRAASFRVAGVAQFTGEGAVEALREMDRLARNGVAQTAREADQTLEHARDRGPEMSERVAGLVAGLARELGRGLGGAGGGADRTGTGTESAERGPSLPTKGPPRARPCTARGPRDTGLQPMRREPRLKAGPGGRRWAG